MSDCMIILKLCDKTHRHLGAVRVKIATYREGISWSAFTSYRHSYHHDTERGIKYHNYFEDDYVWQQESIRRAFELHPTMTNDFLNNFPDPDVTYESVYEFYEAIGYVRSQKRYIH